MSLKIKNFFYLLFIIYANRFSFQQTISIPFDLKIISNHKNYNSTDFFNDYFSNELNLKINIGTPPQEINAILNLNSPCLIFKTAQSKNVYSPKNSSSLTIIEKPNFTYLKGGEDIFYFEGNKKYKLGFLFSNNSDLINNTYLPTIGLDYPFYQMGRFNIIPCYTFITSLYYGNILKKEIWTIKFNSKYSGEFILGENLCSYDPTNYSKIEYSTIYFAQSISFHFDSIIIQENNNRIYYMNNGNQNYSLRESFININSGIIIGTNEYKNLIDKIFFNNLIKKNICKVDIIIKDNIEYYIYSCNSELIGLPNPRYTTKSYYKDFPNLILSLKKIEYNFTLTNSDLFELISGRYYFLIIFKKINLKTDKDSWYLGKPFYIKYPFSINIRDKTIGFYKIIEDNNNIKFNDTQKKDEIKNDNNKLNRNNYKNQILKYIVEVIFILILLFLAYFIGVRVRERRRKIANELKDDNYEYITDKNKDINEVSSNSKRQKFVELISKLGL